jgi:hypothetical protein
VTPVTSQDGCNKNTQSRAQKTALGSCKEQNLDAFCRDQNEQAEETYDF